MGGYLVRPAVNERCQTYGLCVTTSFACELAAFRDFIIHMLHTPKLLTGIRKTQEKHLSGFLPLHFGFPLFLKLLHGTDEHNYISGLSQSITKGVAIKMEVDGSLTLRWTWIVASVPWWLDISCFQSVF